MDLAIRSASMICMLFGGTVCNLHHLQKCRFISSPISKRLSRLVLHKLVAPMLLDYEKKIPFQQPVHICIRSENGDSDREYLLSFWNGSDIGQSCAFQLKRMQIEDSTSEPIHNEYFVHCKTQPQGIRWQWVCNIYI